MHLKFYLNKFLKVDNIEKYTLSALQELKEKYDEFLEDSEGTDPDFPLMSFGNKGKKIKGVNMHKLLEEGETIEDFKRDKLGNVGNLDISKRDPEIYSLNPSEQRKLTRQSREAQRKQYNN